MIDELILGLIDKYNISIVFANSKQLKANAAVLRNSNKYYIFINSSIPEELLVLSFLHEVAHIETNTLGEEYIKYNRYIETKMNIIALKKISKFINPIILFKYIVFALFSENKLYHVFLRNNKLKSEVLLCMKKNNTK